MALEIGIQNYEPKWNSSCGECVDLDNSELKKKYGDGAKIMCCGTLFVTRSSMLQHFKTQKHKNKCLAVATNSYKQELPSSSTPDETINSLIRERRKLRADFSKLSLENEDNKQKLQEMEQSLRETQNILINAASQLNEYVSPSNNVDQETAEKSDKKKTPKLRAADDSSQKTTTSKPEQKVRKLKRSPPSILNNASSSSASASASVSLPAWK